MAFGRSISTAVIALFGCLAGPAAVGQTQPQSASSFNIQLKFPSKTEGRVPCQFELINGVLVFRAVVQGKDVWAILDNRLESSLIDADFVQKAGIMLGSPIGPLRTPTGSLPRRLTSPVQISIPGQISIDAPLSAIDLSFVSKATGRPISLALGKEYFGNLVFLIKPSNHTFQLGPSGTFLAVPATAIPIALRSDRPKLDITVNGVNLLVTLDLGFNGAVALSKAAWIRTGLDKYPVVERKSAHLEGAIFSVAHAKASAVRLGTAKFSAVDVSQPPILPDDGDGLIGLGILSLFDFALDIKAGKLWLIDRRR